MYHTLRLIAATGRKSSIDETTVVGDLDNTYVRQEAHAVDRLELGYMQVHQKEGNIEVPC